MAKNTDNQDTQLDKGDRNGIKKFHVQRISNQVRMLMDLWRLINSEGWSKPRLNQFQSLNSNLTRYARRAENKQTLSMATRIASLLSHSESNSDSLPSGKELEQLSDTLQQLGQISSRISDDVSRGLLPNIAASKPIFLALQDERLAVKMMLQLEFFGFHSEVCCDEATFNREMTKCVPCIVVMDVDFTGKMHFGIDLMRATQKKFDQKIPVVFWSPDTDDIFTQLKAIRAGCVHFQTGKLDHGVMIEAIEHEPAMSAPVPFRVLLVESSRTDAADIEAALSKAGVISLTIMDPMLVCDELEDFQPDLIMLDMVMPGCTGMEIATIIRQQEKYFSVPLIFLTNEETPELRITALREGADDLLTKPVNSQLLGAVIKTKCHRSRSLLEVLKADSLTGLLNHTAILGQLAETTREAQEFNRPCCCAMVDIDHFKSVNDQYGHPVGDRVIKNLSLLLKHRLRKSDYSGRYGGEEFCVVLPNTRIDDARKIFDELRLRFSQSKQVTDKGEFSVSFSCGIAQYEPGQTEKLTVLADEALYEAKKSGRNRVCCYTSGEPILSSIVKGR